VPDAPEPPAAAVDIHTYNPQELLRLLAALLTQIATTNDALPGAPGGTPAGAGKPPIWHTLTTASRASLGTPATALAFHARNVPTIALEAYLLRILKYCPTTNEVFLALLVYFDRMSALVGDATGRTFVIDSFNVHRLVIAGVTVASKFFSDVFYTNSRYAKVCGVSFVSARAPRANKHTGGRPPPRRAQPARAAVPPPQRLPPDRAPGGDAAVCRSARPLLRVRRAAAVVRARRARESAACRTDIRRRRERVRRLD
jgi:hypothetical protein